MPRPFTGEQVIPFKKVRFLECFIEPPSRRQIDRWRKYGIGGVRLEAFRQGSKYFTSVEAVERFVAETNGHLRRE